MKPVKVLSFLMMVVILLTALPGCTSPAPTTAPAAPPAAAPAQPTAVPAKEPDPVVVLYGTDATTLDPHFTANTLTSSLVDHFFSTLVKVDAKTGEIKPSLAESWELVNPTTWRFKLRKDIKFQNGEVFNADVAKYSFDRLIDPKVNAQKWFFVSDADFVSAAVVDPYTIDVVTKAPSAGLLEALRMTAMVPKDYFSKTPLETLAIKPIGSGPYQLKEWVKDDHMTLERWDAYWGPKPAIKTIIIRPVPEAATRISELVSGKADLIVNVGSDQLGQIEACKGCEVRGSTGGRDIYIMIDLRAEPFGDVKARQALNYAVDKQALLDAFFKGKGKILAGVSNSTWENTNLKPYAYDPAKALALFGELGYKKNAAGKLEKDGKTIKYTMNTSSGRYVKDKEVTQAVAADLNKLGLDVTVEVLEWAVLSKAAETATLAPLTLRGLGGFFNGIGELRWVTPAPQFNMDLDRKIRWQSQAFEDQYAKMRAEMDRTKRKVMGDELQKMAFDEAAWIFLYKQYDNYGVNKRLNWQPRADEYIILHDVTITGDRVK